MVTSFPLRGTAWTVDVAFVPRLVPICRGNVQNLFACPDGEKTGNLPQGPMHRFPVYYIELVGEENIALMEGGSCDKSMHPKTQSIAIVRRYFILTNRHANWLQGETLWKFWAIRIPLDYLLFCLVVHLAVQLCGPVQIVISEAFVLVSPHVGEGPRKGQVTAIDKDVFQYVTVFAARRDAVGRKVFHPLNCTKTIRVDVYRALESCMEVIDP